MLKLRNIKNTKLLEPFEQPSIYSHGDREMRKGVFAFRHFTCLEEDTTTLVCKIMDISISVGTQFGDGLMNFEINGKLYDDQPPGHSRNERMLKNIA